MSMKDITLGRYIYGTSVLHRIDPRVKLVSLFVIMSGLFLGSGWNTLVIAGIYIGTLCVLSGLRFSFLFRSLLPFIWLIFMTVILNVVFVGGHILVEAPLPYGGITREGLELGMLYGIRIALFISMASLLTLTTEPIHLVDGVEKLLYPLSKSGLKPQEIAIAMFITIRFIPILIDEAVKIRKSHIARGLRTDSSLKAKLKSISLLFLPLFHSALRRSENLAIAMECRLYRSDCQRTRYNALSMELKDWAALIISVSVAVGIVVS